MVKIGDEYPIGEKADCPHVLRDSANPFPAMCTRDTDHEPPHVACDMTEHVVAVWQ